MISEAPSGGRRKGSSLNLYWAKAQSGRRLQAALRLGSWLWWVHSASTRYIHSKQDPCQGLHPSQTTPQNKPLTILWDYAHQFAFHMENIVRNRTFRNSGHTQAGIQQARVYIEQKMKAQYYQGLGQRQAGFSGPPSWPPDGEAGNRRLMGSRWVWLAPWLEAHIPHTLSSHVWLVGRRGLVFLLWTETVSQKTLNGNWSFLLLYWI